MIPNSLLMQVQRCCIERIFRDAKTNANRRLSGSQMAQLAISLVHVKDGYAVYVGETAFAYGAVSIIKLF